MQSLERQQRDPFKARLHPAIAPIPFVVTIDRAAEEQAQGLVARDLDAVGDRHGPEPRREPRLGREPDGQTGIELLRGEPLAEMFGLQQASRETTG